MDDSVAKAKALLELAQSEMPPQRAAQKFGLAEQDFAHLRELAALLFPGILQDAEDEDDEERTVVLLALDSLLAADDADAVKEAMERIRDEGQLSSEAMDLVTRVSEDFAGDTDDTEKIVGQIKDYVRQIRAAGSRQEAEAVVNAARQQNEREGDPPFRVRLHLSKLATLLFGESEDEDEEQGDPDQEGDEDEDEQDAGNEATLDAIRELLKAEDAEAAQAVIERLEGEGEIDEGDLETLGALQKRIAEGKTLRKYVRKVLAAPSTEEADTLIESAAQDKALTADDTDLLREVAGLRFPNDDDDEDQDEDGENGGEGTGD